MYEGAITDVQGIEVGHARDERAMTGVTVVLARDGAVAAVDVRGAAPGTRETDLMAPGNLIQKANAIALCGGSAFGLDACGGVMRYLEERRCGVDTGVAIVPIVGGAVIFDLAVGDAAVRPDAAMGYHACENASAAAPEQGPVGAGAGATVGKILGALSAMPAGVGTASITSASGLVVGALVVVNAVGDVVDPRSGKIVCGARSPSGGWLDTQRALLNGAGGSVLPGTNTTIGVVATNAKLDRGQALRLAMSGHDGLSWAIRPAHTMNDGDALFALATGASGAAFDMTVLCAMAAQAVAHAIVNAAGGPAQFE